MEQTNEIQDVLSRSYGMPEVDESELDAELDSIAADMAADADSSYLDALNAPTVPSKEPGVDSMLPAAAGKQPVRFTTSYFDPLDQTKLVGLFVAF